jgi:hypothetical protein
MVICENGSIDGEVWGLFRDGWDEAGWPGGAFWLGGGGGYNGSCAVM